MQKEQYDQTKKRIEQMIAVTEEQVKVAGKAVGIQAELEKSETKYKLALELSNIKISSFDFNTTNKQIKESFILNHCSYILQNDKQVIKNVENPLFLEQLLNPKLKVWKKHELNMNDRTLSRNTNYWSYTVNLNFDNTQLSLFCKESSLNKNHRSFEEDIKINVQKTFALTHKFHKGKTYLMWINPKYLNEDFRPLYEEDEKKRRSRYSISNMSDVENIFTGNLSAKQINTAKDKEPLSHMLNNKKALTWIKNLSEGKNDYTFLLVTTIYEEDLETQVDSTFWKILPASLTALFFAIIAGFFLFKRLFKGINILSNTAKQVNMGNKNIRSQVKGNDDVGHLGIAFDSMLDSLQQNIKTLDSKVEKKTIELKTSLNEKEILLKEIHHRVKNNLALTIGLIKLQQSKIKDENTKKILKDIQERIYTMELLHRKLYESTNLNHINFNEYVTNLVYDIENTYNYHENISIKIKIDDIFLDIEKAMPCGLILNELITNSFKYAFKNNKKAKLKISMKKIENKYELILKDNGKGIPSNIDIYNSNTLGLKLINSISKQQLNGDFIYNKNNGSEFIIIF